MLKRFVFVSVSVFLGTFSVPSFAQQDVTTEHQRPVVSAPPEPLDWRKVKVPELLYSRIPVEGASSIYIVPTPGEKMFRIDLLFAQGVYTLPRAKRTALQATADLFLEGGVGSIPSNQVDRVLQSRGLSVSTSLSAKGFFRVRIQGLADDFESGLAFIEDLLLRPRFEPEALDVWKKNAIAAFEGVVVAGQVSRQVQILEQQIISEVFGPSHYYASMLKRMSPSTIESVSLGEVKDLAKVLVNRAGLNAVLAGRYPPDGEKRLQRLVEKIPRGESVILSWLPDNPLPSAIGKARIVYVQKPDMNQSQVLVRTFFPKMRELSPIDEAKLLVAMEVFSSSAGVVGNDRFSKAIRADSGLSYMAHAGCDDDYLKPAWALLTCTMVFQSPNDRIAEALNVARRTWDEFLSKGISESELTRARVSRMNRILGLELTPFDRLRDVLVSLEEGRTIPVVPLERALLRLEKQTDVSQVNAFLKELATEERITVIGVMGAGGKPALDQVAKLPDLSSVRTVDFQEILNDLK